jgi:hypothetical protein
MDMSFLLKQFLPPGVSVEQLQETGLEVVKRILAAAQRIEENHALLTEQNAMLRYIVAQSQEVEQTFPKGTPNVPESLTALLSSVQYPLGGGNDLGGVSAPGAGDPNNSCHGGNADCDPGHDGPG